MANVVGLFAEPEIDARFESLRSTARRHLFAHTGYNKKNLVFGNWRIQQRST